MILSPFHSVAATLNGHHYHGTLPLPLRRFRKNSHVHVQVSALARQSPLTKWILQSIWHSIILCHLSTLLVPPDQLALVLADPASKLRGANLGGCRNITDDSVVAFEKNCLLLRWMKLSNAINITDASVSVLVRFCPILIEIDLNGCPKVTDVLVRGLPCSSARVEACYSERRATLP